MDILENLRLSVSRDTRIVALTGAGISAESGVPIFRGQGSMWENPIARELARKIGPPWNTRETWEFYEWRRQLVSNCQPNAAHLALVKIENIFKDFCLITQNVDGLHPRAGSRCVCELHGNMWKGRCPRDGALVDLRQTPMESLPPYHNCGTALRPHVVQFGELIDVEILKTAVGACKRADLFFVIGTSGVVSPASQMPFIALGNGAMIIEFNREKTILTPHVSLSLRGKAADTLPKIWLQIRKLVIR